MKHLVIAVAVGALACGSSSVRPGGPGAQALGVQDRVEHQLAAMVAVRGEDSHTALAARMAELKIPGVSIAVFDDYRLVWAKAYGKADVELDQPATEATLFQAASISKPVNALAVLGLALDRVVDLDAPINSILTRWKLPDNALTAATPVTLRRLLSHTAGTTVHGFAGYAAGAELPTLTQILDGQPPANSPPVRVDLAPGTELRYSGGGITIAQTAVEDATHRPYAALVRERVLEPLGMIDSTFEQPLPDARLAAMAAAAGYLADGTAVPGKRHVYPELAAAGLWTTPTDLSKFLIEVQRGLAGRSQVVTRELAQLLTTEVDHQAHGALGVFLEDHHGTSTFGHDGSNAGFQCHAIASLTGGFGLVIMTNSENGHALFPQIERTVWAAMAWPGGAPPLERVALSAAERAALTGRYLRDGRVLIQVTDEGGRLWIAVPLLSHAEAVPIAATELVDPTDGKHVRRTAAGGYEVGVPDAGGMQPATKLEPSVQVPYELLAAGDRDAAIALWKRLVAAPSPPGFTEEAFANQLGYALLGAGKTDAALTLLGAVTEVFPASANAWDSYGDALAAAGRRAEAIAASERGLGLLDADTAMPADAKPGWRTQVEDKLARLRAAAATRP